MTEADGQSPKLLDQMRAVLRLHRYAIRTERAYCDWVRRYVKFHGMRSREDLTGGQGEGGGVLDGFGGARTGSALHAESGVSGLRVEGGLEILKV